MIFERIISLPDNVSYPSSKNVWGKSYWITLHNMAANYPDKPSKEDRKKMKDAVSGILSNLPCGECSEHLKIHLKKAKINYRNKKTLSESLCKLHNMVNNNLGKEEVNCSTILGESCTECNVTLKDTKPKFSTKYESYINSIKKIIAERCKEAGIPEPKVIFGECPTDRNTSCTVADVETKDATIYINPNQASLRTIEHELEHYVRVQKGDIEGAKDELSVDTHARSIVNRNLQAPLIMADNQVIDEGKLVLKDTRFDGKSDGRGGIFAPLDKLFQPIASATGLKASDLNDANVPEILGYTANAVEDMFLTPLGTVLTNIITGVAAYGATMVMNDMPVRDKKFLAEFGSHQFWSIIRYANPNTNAIAHAQALKAGRSFAKADLGGFMSAFVRGSNAFGVNTPKTLNMEKVRTNPNYNPNLQTQAPPAPPKPQDSYYVNT